MAIPRGLFDVTPRGDSPYYKSDILELPKVPQIQRQPPASLVRTRNVQAKMNPVELYHSFPIRVIHGDIFSMVGDSTITTEPVSLSVSTGFSHAINRMCDGQLSQNLRSICSNPQPNQMIKVTVNTYCFRSVYFFLVPESGYRVQEIESIVSKYMTSSHHCREKSLLIPCIRDNQKKHSTADIVHHIVKAVVEWLRENRNDFENITFIE